MTRVKPVVLLVLDGLGLAPDSPGNAVTTTPTPNLNGLWKNYPHCYLEASGNSVGLPRGVNGNSEVGHISLGAGKILFQEIARIDYEIDHGLFYRNKTFHDTLTHLETHGGNLHLMGLVSPGKVHSSMNHLYACLEFCKHAAFPSEKVFIHAFTDGRDTAPQSASGYLEELEKKTKDLGIGKIATVIGRYYAMDRDNRWARTKQTYDMMVKGEGIQVKHWREAIQGSYDNKFTDEFIKAHVINENSKPVATIRKNDAIIFFNYRADRAVQLAKAFESRVPIKDWPRVMIENLRFVGFSNYEKGLIMNRASEDVALPGGESQMVKDLFAKELLKTTGFPELQIFPPEKVEHSLGEIISEAGLSQLRLTESEKFPHVTYFFNCRNKNPFAREDRIEIPSPRDVATYDQKPEMSSYQVTEELIKKINENLLDFYVVNFAATDMVAHTGKLEASQKAVAVVDECLGKIVNAVLQKGGSVFVTSDHGNVEELVNLQTGEVDTEHSTNPVPFILASNQFQPLDLTKGFLADVAPTILAHMSIDKPEGMVGRNLLG